MIDYSELAQKLKSARETAGLTQAELAQRAELSLFTLAKLEQGKVKQPSFFTILALAEQLSISIDKLTGLATNAAHSGLEDSWSEVSWCFVDANMLFSGWLESIGLLAEQIGVDSLKLEHVFLTHRSQLFSGQMTVYEFEQLVGDKFDVSARKIDLREIWFNTLRVPTDLLQLLRGLYTRGVTIGVVGTVSKQLLDDLVKRSNLPPFLADDKTWVLGATEPGSTELFEVAERVADQLPKQLLFVSDNPELAALAASRNWQAHVRSVDALST